MKSDDFKKDTRSPVLIAQTILNMPAGEHGQDFRNLLDFFWQRWQTAGRMPSLASSETNAKAELQLPQHTHACIDLYSALDAIATEKNHSRLKAILSNAPGLVGRLITEGREHDITATASQLEAIQSELIALNQRLGFDRARR